MSKVTVYSKPGCQPCKATKRALDKANVSYDEFDISADPAALARVKALGFQKAPVVVTEDDAWFGHNATKLDVLFASLKVAA